MVSLILIGCACLLPLALVLMRTCLLIVTVINQSMVPALAPGDRVLVLRKHLVPRLRKGQIVVIILPHERASNPADRQPTLYIKRIVALGGETFDDRYASTKKGTVDIGLDQERHTWHIPPDCLFVCGDNQNLSIDSRTWGPLPTKSIQGVVLGRLRRKALVPCMPPAPQRLPSGKPAPFFSAPSLNGEMLTLHHYRGQKVLLLFIAAHKVCRSLLPSYLSQLTNTVATGLTMVCVSADEVARTRAFCEELHITVPVLIAPREQNSFLNDYRVSGTPAYCLLDAQGIVLAAGSPGKYDQPWQALLLQRQN